MTVAYQLKDYNDYYAYFDDNKVVRLVKVNEKGIQKHVAINKGTCYRVAVEKGKQKSLSFFTVIDQMNKSVVLKLLADTPNIPTVSVDSLQSSILSVPTSTIPHDTMVKSLGNAKVVRKQTKAQEPIPTQTQDSTPKTSFMEEYTKDKLKLPFESCINTKLIITHSELNILRQHVKQLTATNRYWQLSSPYHAYVYDSVDKKMFSLIAARRIDAAIDDVAFTQLKKTEDRWHLMNAIVRKSKAISQTMIDLMLYNWYCSVYEMPEKTEQKASYMVVEASMGFCANKDKLTTELEASKLCRKLLERDNSMTYFIVKVVGVATYSNKYECKRLDK